MKEPAERFTADVLYNPQTQMIRCEFPYSDYNTLIKRGYRKAEITLIDDRKLSVQQRKACYAMLGEIADYMGDEKSEVKELMKIEFLTSELCQTGEKLFSMSDAPMSTVAAFQRFLARFIIRYDIPTKKPMLVYVDDLEDYIYTCLANKKCCVCGKPSDLHHVDAVGMGNDRDEIVHEGMRALPLCREHHSEAHTIGNQAFVDRYHLIMGLRLDKNLCKKYKLKEKSDE